MKKITTIILSGLFLASCAATGPVGQWDYSVTGTPQGDYSGVMTISKTTDGYAAKMSGQAGDIAFEKFSYDKKLKLTKGTFYFSGVDVAFDAKVSKEAMKGTMSAGGGDFPFSATKKK